MYQLKQSKSFTRMLKQIVKQRRLDPEKINSVFYQLALDPFSSSLRTHKVNTRSLGLQYSSRIDKDLRLIWNFDKDENLIILLLDLGGHSGNKSVY